MQVDWVESKGGGGEVSDQCLVGDKGGRFLFPPERAAGVACQPKGNVGGIYERPVELGKTQYN